MARESSMVGRVSRKQGHLADETAQGKLRSQDKTRRLEREFDMRAVMSTPQGRRFVLWLIESSNTHGGSFALGGEDGRRLTDYNEGRRSVGLDIKAECQRVTPQEWVHMLTEQSSRHMEDSLRRDAAVATPPGDDDAGSSGRALTDDTASGDE